MLIGCAALLTITSVGCAGSATMRTGVVYNDPVVYVETVPSYVYQQPAVYYRGYPAYWVDNRWYYQSPSGWVVFRREPAHLHQYRIRYYSRVAGPAVRVQGPRTSVRVRAPNPRVRVRGRVHGRGEVRTSR